MTAVDATRVQVQSPVRVPARTVSGTCHHDCPDSCGWHVTVEERSDRRRSRCSCAATPQHPFSAGELCPKVNRFLDRVYSPTGCSRRCVARGRKGEGRFVPISWDDALAEIGRAGSPTSSTVTAPRRSCRSRAPATRASSRWGSPSGSGTVSARTRVADGDLRRHGRRRRGDHQRHRPRRSIRSSCATLG